VLIHINRHISQLIGVVCSHQDQLSLNLFTKLRDNLQLLQTNENTPNAKQLILFYLEHWYQVLAL